jgi:hypothetical protein
MTPLNKTKARREMSDRSEYQKAWYQANKEKKLAQSRAWYKANKERKLQTCRAWQDANREKFEEMKRVYYKTYYEINRDKKIATCKAWREANKEKIALRMKAYQRENMDKFVAYTGKRRAAKLNRTPPWLTDTDFEKIERKYAQAQHRTKTTGERWVVDHVIPLRGVVVSGLHVPSNLRVIKATTNSSKRNKFDLEKEWGLA